MDVYAINKGLQFYFCLSFYFDEHPIFRDGCFAYMGSAGISCHEPLQSPLQYAAGADHSLTVYMVSDIFSSNFAVINFQGHGHGHIVLDPDCDDHL